MHVDEQQFLLDAYCPHNGSVPEDIYVFTSSSARLRARVGWCLELSLVGMEQLSSQLCSS
jgi:hypothetical protein